MQFRKGMVRGVFAFTLLLGVAAGAMIFNSSVELTEAGVHKRLLLPLGPLGKAAIPLYAGTGDQPVLPGHLDGPVVRHEANGDWSATWFCEDRVLRRRGNGPELSLDCAGKHMRYPLQAMPAAAPSEFDMPSKLLVLSDIEGNFTFLDAALRELDVADADGNWRFGDNRLVILGDAVDRGRDVFAVLWRLYALDQQARAAGGAVHLLLGNHEQYLLRGNTSRANSDHLYALDQIGGQQQAFAADTVLGRWLRQQPVIMRAGRVLLTHGGISPEVAASGLPVRALNQAMADYWRGQGAQPAALEAVLGQAGLTQYRGYFEDGGERYRKASSAEVAKALQAFDADLVVVGHTLVERVSLLHDDHVYAVDVNTGEAASEALLFDEGVPRVVALKTRRFESDGRQARRNTRRLDLLAAGDRDMLERSILRSFELYRLPHPY